MSIGRREFLKITGAAPALAAGSTVLLAKEGKDLLEALPNLAKDVKPVPLEEYGKRIDKARRLLKANGASALLVEAGSSLRYFTGFSWGRSERTFAFLIPVRGKPAFVSPAFEKGRAEEQIQFPDADVRIWQENESPFKVIGSILADRKVKSGRLFVEPTTRYFLITGMQRDIPGLEVADGRPVSDGCRMTKSPLELEYMRLANRITKRAYRVAFQSLREGMEASAIASIVREAHRRMGVSGGAMVLLGPNSALPHGSRTPRKLRSGDVVLIDGGCSLQGYRSDVTRTGVFGKPSDKQRKVWDIVFEAQTRALKTARPGVQCQAVDHAARSFIAESGYGPGYRYFTHRLGHGIGLDGHESPYLVQGNTLKMKSSMTFSDEPGIYIVGEWGIRHEDIMAITEEGAELLGERTKNIQDPV